MNLDRLNQWLSLGANVGVVVGFLLMAAQLNLNTEAIRLQNRLDLNRGVTAAETAFMGETTYIAFANAVLKPSELTDEQMLQLWAYLNVGLSAAENTWIAYEAGFATEGDWEDARRLAKTFLAFKVGQIYWENAKANYGAEFVEAVDVDLSSSDLDRTARQYRGMLADIRQLGQDDQSAQ